MTTPSPSAAKPHVSIVIPVYNEEGILRGSVLELREKLRPFGFTYELILCENGSRDRTVEMGKEIEADFPEVRMISVGEPNYGLAMKTGILAARGDFVICDEIDLCDTEFYARALALLERTDTDLVVGSKAMVGSNDQRPWVPAYTTAFCARCAASAEPTRTGSRPSSARFCWRPRNGACSTATSLPASSSFERTAKRRRWWRSRSPCTRSDHPRSIFSSGFPTCSRAWPSWPCRCARRKCS